MTTPAPIYDRAPSRELQALMEPGGFLAPLIELASKEVGGHYHDVHFRMNDEVHVYRGHARLITVRRLVDSRVNLTAHPTYTNQLCAGGLFRRWQVDESGFGERLSHYLSNVEVGRRWTHGEGSVQEQWSRVRELWIPFDREAELDYGNYAGDSEREFARKFEQVAEARIGLEKLGLAELPKPGRALDQLAIDREGQLVLLELKDGSKSNAGVYYSPYQLLQYIREWHYAMDGVKNGLQAVIDSRAKLGLAPPDVPRLSGRVRAAVGFGFDTPRSATKDNYARVLEIVNRHLPAGVEPIKTWTFTVSGPILVT